MATAIKIFHPAPAALAPTQTYPIDSQNFKNEVNSVRVPVKRKSFFHFLKSIHFEHHRFVAVAALRFGSGSDYTYTKLLLSAPAQLEGFPFHKKAN
jgi:hypothetical protein